MLRELFPIGEATGLYSPVAHRLIAARTGLHESTVQRVASHLSRAGYTHRRRHALTLINPAGAFNAWLAHYDVSGQVVATFHLPYDWPSLRLVLADLWRDLTWAWTGIAGLSLVGKPSAPIQKVCYVTTSDAPQARDRLVRRLGALAVDEGGTLAVVIPREPRAQLHRLRDIAGSPVVSTVQLALDVTTLPISVHAAPARLAVWQMLIPPSAVSDTIAHMRVS